tara:strand:- start:3 stop:569 length:567 start_codon:yes stop_codon:yes gene_type:complete
MDKKMKVLDLFCGLGGWSKAFADSGYNCTGVDIVNIGYPYRFIKADLFDWTPDQKYDIVLASPPCTNFSKTVMNWTGKTNEMKGLNLIWKTFSLIQDIKPKFWVIENVKGLSEFIDEPNDIVRYGKSAHRKAAYLWSNIGKLGMLDSMIIKKTNRKTFKSGDPELAKIPYELSYAVMKKTQEQLNKYY